MAAGIGSAACAWHFPTACARPRAKSLDILLMTIGLFGSVSWFWRRAISALSGCAMRRRPWRKAGREHRRCSSTSGPVVPACKEMERRTFADPAVKARACPLRALRIDCTEGSPQSDALQKKYDSETLPSVLLFDSQGQRSPSCEFTPPDKLLPILSQIR